VSMRGSLSLSFSSLPLPLLFPERNPSKQSIFRLAISPLEKAGYPSILEFTKYVSDLRYDMRSRLLIAVFFFFIPIKETIIVRSRCV